MSLEQAMKKILPNAGSDLEHFVSAFATDLLLTQALSYDGSARTEYIGYALPGTSQSQAKWCIKKHTYGAGGVTDIQFASGNANFDKIWTDRAGYSFS